MTKTITVRLTKITEHELNWLLKDLNKEPKVYADQTISDIIRTAIHNEYIDYNISHMDCNEDEECDPQWIVTYGARWIEKYR